jgi:hypothetical protein
VVLKRLKFFLEMTLSSKGDMFGTASSTKNATNQGLQQSKELPSVAQENKLRKIMTMTPGESAKDKGVLFLELREICSYFYTQFLQSQVFLVDVIFLFFVIVDTDRRS